MLGTCLPLRLCCWRCLELSAEQQVIDGSAIYESPYVTNELWFASGFCRAAEFVLDTSVYVPRCGVHSRERVSAPARSQCRTRTSIKLYAAAGYHEIGCRAYIEVTPIHTDYFELCRIRTQSYRRA